MKTKDPDILALERAKKALLKSTSHRMAKANLAYLTDYFVSNPSVELNKHWEEKQEKAEDK